MTCIFAMSDIQKQFELDLLTMLGLQGRSIKKLVFTLEQGLPPSIEVSEFLFSVPDVLVTKTYTVTEVN